MAEEKDTLTSAPDDGSADSAGHVDEAQESSQGVAEQPTTPSQEQQAPAAETKPVREPKYLGKKYSDVFQLEDALDHAVGKISDTGREKNVLAQQNALLAQQLQSLGMQVPPEYQPQTVEQPQVSEQKLEALTRQITQTNLRLAQAEEDRIFDQVVQEKPHLANARDMMRAFWRSNPKLDQYEVADRFEKLVSLGRSENKEDMLKKKTTAVETGKKATEAPAPAGDGQSKVQRAMQHSAENLNVDLDVWADALPDSLWNQAPK